MAYDRADWHSGGDFPKDLPQEAGGTHIGMFLAWVILHGLEGEFHRAESAESLARVRARTMTGREFLFKECDGKLWDEDLSDEGNAFARSYYSDDEGNFGDYITEYSDALARDLPSEYHVADTWTNYDRLDPVITRRYRAWRG